MQPLPRQATPSAIKNINKSMVLATVGFFILLSIGVVYAISHWWHSPSPAPIETAQQPRPASAKPSMLKEVPTRYDQIRAEPRLPPKGIALPSIKIAEAAASPLPAVVAPPAPPIAKAPELTKAEMEGLIRQAVTEAVAAQAAKNPPANTPTSGAAPAMAAAKPEKPRWIGGEQGKSIAFTGHQNQAQKPSAEKEKNKDDSKAEILIREAVWAKPSHVEHILFEDQLIPGKLLTNLNSDIPGSVFIMVTRDVLDIDQRGFVLIPQFTRIFAKQTGKPEFGQTRFDITVYKMRFPDGTLMQVDQDSKLSDRDGSNGLDANVDNHFGKLLLGTGISAILNVGASSIAGTPSGFFQNPAQQAAQQAGQSIQRDADNVVKAQLKVAPTLKREAGTEVTLHLSQSYNFGKTPFVVP